MIKEKYIDEILEKFKFDKTKLLKILLEIQKERNYISKEELIYISKRLKIELAKIHEVTSFFSAINTTVKGKFIINLCDSTVCRLNKNNIIKEALEEELKIKFGETTEDGIFSLEFTPCFGACDISPAMKIGDKVYGNLTKEKVIKIVNELRGDNIE